MKVLWLSRVPTLATMCRIATTHSTVSTMIKEMEGVGGTV